MCPSCNPAVCPSCNHAVCPSCNPAVCPSCNHASRGPACGPASHGPACVIIQGFVILRCVCGFALHGGMYAKLAQESNIFCSFL